MSTKSERREEKRKKAREGKLLRGERSVFTMWLRTLKRNRYWKAGTLEELEPSNTDEPRSGGSFKLCKHGENMPPYVRRK